MNSNSLHTDIKYRNLVSTLPIDNQKWQRLHPELFPKKGIMAWRFYLILFIGILLFFAGLIELDITVDRIFHGVKKLSDVFSMMIPPEPKGRIVEYLGAITQTVSMAFFGTLVASLIALPLALLGARNIMPMGFIRFIVKRSSDTVRGLDSLIWAIFFVSIVGLGPFAGILAIAITDIGILTKLFAEALENTDTEQVKGVRSTGAGKFQTIKFGFIPQVMPVFLANSLYFLESNVRSATILGVVGAGGIGFFLMDRMLINAWREVSVIIILILLTVYFIDLISRIIRKSLIGKSSLSIK